MHVSGRIVIVLIIVVGSAALVYGIVGRAPRVIQPIVFNHAVHVNEAGLQCADCHADAETHVHAGFPAKGVCLDCHDIDDEEGSHPEKDKLFAFDEDPREIPWVRVAVTAPDVFFSHRRHVRAANLDCLVCHADQATQSEPPSTAQLVMSMNACIACHEENNVSNDCLTCHR